MISSEEEEEENVNSFNESNEGFEKLNSSFSGISDAYCSDADGEREVNDVKNLSPACGSGSTLKDVCGLSKEKEILLNIFLYPALFPHLFPKKIRWNKILFYGPPGTGKTMLAKAIATEMNAELHRISGGDLLSHWQGESEKQIRRLFEKVRSSSKTTILFFDEIDGLCRRRTLAEDDHVRRIKTELLTQFDDFATETENYQSSYIIGATNCPWEIDFGFMRRFHKKIFIPLPEKEARLDMIKRNFEGTETSLTESEWNEIATKTEGYSGSDLMNLVMSSCCERFLQIKKCKYWQAKGDLWIPATSQSSLFLTRMNFDDIPRNKVGSRRIILADLEAAMTNTPKTALQKNRFEEEDIECLECLVDEDRKKKKKMAFSLPGK